MISSMCSYPQFECIRAVSAVFVVRTLGSSAPFSVYLFYHLVSLIMQERHHYSNYSWPYLAALVAKWQWVDDPDSYNFVVLQWYTGVSEFMIERALSAFQQDYGYRYGFTDRIAMFRDAHPLNENRN